jgi:tRNA(His) guanylyltransferase
MSKGKDDLGDRMKMYEVKESEKRFLPLLPILARMDGRSFSSWTKDLDRPYDERMIKVMQETTAQLVKETNACIGYTQSDEISLVFYSEDFKSQIFFDRREQKMVSMLAAMTAALFNSFVPDYFDKPRKQGYFDCRVWQVPVLEEAANTILWRELDATKNSVSMATRAYYSHKAMKDKRREDQMDMLMAKGVNWNDFPAHFKRGTFFQRKKTVRPFEVEELALLPEKHAARTNPNLLVERTDVVSVNMPPFAKVTNRVGVIFFGQDPIVNGNGSY